ncbi:MAG TPA: DUF1801 domain-containing protein [Candidatus Woesebacteria bacterium]|nr:DUF1801 domain-containing protein [Candidatus Woesebacteria bacterium]
MNMQPYTNIDEYIANFPEETQLILQKIRKIGHELISHAEETISYGIPTLKLNGKYVFYFAGYKEHISVYPILQVPEEFFKKIQPFIKGKGTLQFPLSKPIPFNLIKQFVKYSLQAHTERIQKNT